jgi:hypothetical protein
MSETARIFREMREVQSAEQIRDSMKHNILGEAKAWLGNVYEKGQDFAHESGLVGALNDIYRRCIENSWFGKDLFDGRFQSDTQQLGTNYDQRASFYQLDNPQERDRGEDLER